MLPQTTEEVVVASTKFIDIPQRLACLYNKVRIENMHKVDIFVIALASIVNNDCDSSHNDAYVYRAINQSMLKPR